MYIVGPDGTSYGYSNDHDPSDINKAMDLALANYRKSPPRHVDIAAADMQAPFAITPRATTAVVHVYSRIDPVPAGSHGLNKGIGRDHLWIYQDDVQAIEALAKRSPGGFKLPASLAMRIARFHLMDDVRGTPDMWSASEVKHVSLRGKAVNSAAGPETVEFTGSFSMRTASGCRGYAGDVKGRIEIDNAASSVKQFRAYADGLAWGDGTYTPNAPKGRYHLKIAMVEATDAASRVVPPEAVSTENRDAGYHHP